MSVIDDTETDDIERKYSNWQPVLPAPAKLPPLISWNCILGTTRVAIKSEHESDVMKSSNARKVFHLVANTVLKKNTIHKTVIEYISYQDRPMVTIPKSLSIKVNKVNTKYQILKHQIPSVGVRYLFYFINFNNFMLHHYCLLTQE